MSGKILHLLKFISLKILIHHEAKMPLRVISSDPEEVLLTSKRCTGALWELAEKFPEEIIGWCEKDLEENLALEKWQDLFHHHLIMASFAVTTNFLPEAIGYVDPMPFINVNRNVSYGTWLMSSDVGGMKGKTLLKFRPFLEKESSFGYLLNSVAKIGQQNGLFCYSEPRLVKDAKNNSPEATAGKNELFRFVYQHYTSARASVLPLCLGIYEKLAPLVPYTSSFFNAKYFQKSVDLSPELAVSKKIQESPETIDVIIPTMGRASYLYDVLRDFSVQTHLPEKIIIVEQNPDPDSASELDFLQDKKWPFEIVHHFIHRTGACNARNRALEEVKSNWIFFADDDIRFKKNLIENIFAEIKRLNLCAVNMNCKQPGETTVFGKIKQWGSFGSGTGVVKSTYAKKSKFSTVFEHGNGEDADFGKQLRDLGCDIIYHPDLEIKHLKAPSGGFRQRPALGWEREKPLPKPSPTVMIYAFRNYTLQQLRGYKVSLFIKFYPRQGIKNPVSYFSSMKKRWKKSTAWAEKLLRERED